MSEQQAQPQAREERGPRGPRKKFATSP